MPYNVGMVRLIAAIDLQRGIANDSGIPWRLPGDIQYFRSKIAGQTMLMGRGVYDEIKSPLGAARNLVVTRSTEPLRSGYEKVHDLEAFIEKATDDIWVAGGAMIFKETIQYADELYLTLINAQFGCTKFFPEYEQDFELFSSTPPITENGISYSFTVWKRKS